ncbi:MAG: calcium-binding protein [Sphingomonadaceae bacterium]|nr:calcium-binding protein [Sphingomonadaceae bacterium]
MATPVEWLGNFQVNTGGAATGTQSDPHITGLANGNILVAWTESADGTIGTSPGTDIVGQLYDSEGNAIGTAFQINSALNVDDEGDFDIAATNDGGWVMVYIDNDISDVNQTSVIWERYDSTGAPTDFATLADELVAADFLANPQVAVDLTNNLSFVTYTDDVGTDTDINGRTVDDAGAVSAEFAAAQNSTDFDRNGDVAVLSNGNFVSVFEEDDTATTGFVSIEFRIMTSAGAIVTSLTVDSGSAGSANSPKVASLAGGGFVVVWNENDDVFYRVFDNAGAQTVATTAAASGADLQNEADVVALADGGFVISWDDDTDLHTEARRFTAAGVGDGVQFTIQANDGTSPALGLTADGRILSVADDIGGNGELFASIWDPRGATINASDYTAFTTNFLDANVIVGGTGSTTINGNDVSGLTIRGQAGNDTIVGGFNNQTILGGGGSDSIAGGELFVDPTSLIGDNIDGGTGSDTIVAAGGDDTITGGDGFDSIDAGAGNDSVDGGLNADTILGGLGNDTIFADAGLGSVEADSIIGAGGDDSLTGATANDTLQGGSGFDDLSGREGDDLLVGAGEDDTLGGGLGFDSLDGGNGSDSLTGGGGDDTLQGGGDADTLNGAGGIDFADYSAASAKVVADLKSPGNNTNAALGDSYVSIENLRGTALRDKLAGDDNGNRLEGLAENDQLNGRAGNDTLVGGQGKDRLKGGEDADQFVLNDISLKDKIIDFESGIDEIALDGGVFGLPAGALSPSAFVIGTQAGDINDRIIYDAIKGKLYFDADGTGASAKVLIATLGGDPTLAASDFIVI